MSTTLGTAVPANAPEVPPDLVRARLLHRRLLGAIYDVGLTEAVPGSWVTPACSGFYFSPFNLRQADRLIVALEDLGVVLEKAGLQEHFRAGAHPGSGQQAFDFGGSA